MIATIINPKLAGIRSRIEAVCIRREPPRQPASVTLVAVSKRQPAETISAAHTCGLRDFGENYVQEASAKAAELACAADCTWHLIGPLQSNKTGEAARLFGWIHTLDRLKTARRLGAARLDAGLPDMQACVQVNLGDETGKAGLPVTEVGAFLAQARDIAGLKLRGLMCIPEQGLDRSGRLGRFGELATLLRDCQAGMPELDTLSMGMSADWPEALEQGATMLRLGTALFGARQ